ncbi:MAG: glycosyltransferase [Endomicrobiia bacterium]
MNILFLTHSFPYPPDEGIKLMSYNLLKEFSKRHTVTLLSFIWSDDEKKYIPEISKFCKRVEVVKHKIPKSFIRRFYNIFFQKEPFCVHQFYSEEFKEKLKKIISNQKFDIVHFDFVNTSFYRNFLLDIPAIFFPHDAMSMLFYRNIEKEKNIFRKLYTYSQYKKMLYYEKEIMPKFEKTVVVSPKDKEWLLSLNSNFDIEVIPNGVDANYFHPLNIEEDYPSVIFRGIMSFLPNIDAAVYFADKILPIIQKEIPNLKYYIVGPNPDEKIKKLSSENNIVTGYVEDIRPYIAKSTVNVCPMRIGSGIKNKILEAMAMAKPTVATSIAIEGIPDVTDGENILIADTPEEFAKKVILLIKDENLRKKIGKNAREFVIKNYTWEKAAEKFENVYKEVIKNVRYLWNF